MKLKHLTVVMLLLSVTIAAVFWCTGPSFPEFDKTSFVIGVVQSKGHLPVVVSATNDGRSVWLVEADRLLAGEGVRYGNVGAKIRLSPPVTSGCILDGGRAFAVTTYDGLVRIFDANGALTKTIKGCPFCRAIAASEDSIHMCGDNGIVCRIGLGANVVQKSKIDLRGHDSLFLPALSSTYELLATVGEASHVAAVYSIQTCSRVCAIDVGEAIDGIWFCGEALFISTNGSTDKCRIWRSQLPLHPSSQAYPLTPSKGRFACDVAGATEAALQLPGKSHASRSVVWIHRKISDKATGTELVGIRDSGVCHGVVSGHFVAYVRREVKAAFVCAEP